MFCIVLCILYHVVFCTVGMTKEGAVDKNGQAAKDRKVTNEERHGRRKSKKEDSYEVWSHILGNYWSSEMSEVKMNFTQAEELTKTGKEK